MSDDGPSDDQFVGFFVASASIGDDIDSLADLCLLLHARVAAAGVGEVDGLCDEGDEQAIFAYGPDARRLFAVMEPLLRCYPLRPARALLRLGPVDDETGEEVGLEL